MRTASRRSSLIVTVVVAIGASSCSAALPDRATGRSGAARTAPACQPKPGC